MMHGNTSSPQKIRFSITELTPFCQFLLYLSFIESIGGIISYHMAYYFSVSSTFSNVHIGLLGFILGLGGIVGSVAGGYWSGKYNTTSLLGLNFLFMGISFLCLPLSQSIGMSIIWSFILGFGVNCFITINNASFLYLTALNNFNLSVTQSYKNAIQNAGSSIALIFVMFFGQHYFRHFVFCLGLSLSLIGIYVFKQKSFSTEHDVIPKKHDSPAQNKASSALIPVIFAVFLIGLNYGIQKTVLGIHLNHTIHNSVIIGFLFLLDSLIVTAFQVPFSKWYASFSLGFVAIVGAILLGVATFALQFAHSVLALTFSLILFSIGEMLFMPNSITLSHQLGGQAHRGLGMGAWRSAYAIGMMLGPLIAGVVMHYSTPQGTWLLSSLVCFIAAGLMYSQIHSRLPIASPT